MPETPNYSEADTRAKLIDPAIHKRGWTEDHILREENAGGLYKIRGRWRCDQKFADYRLHIPVGDGPPVIGTLYVQQWAPVLCRTGTGRCASRRAATCRIACG